MTSQALIRAIITRRVSRRTHRTSPPRSSRTAAGATPSDASSITTSTDEGSSTPGRSLDCSSLDCSSPGCSSLGCSSLAGDAACDGLADGETDGETPDSTHKSGTTPGITHESSTTSTGSPDDCAGGATTNDNPNAATTMQAKARPTGTRGIHDKTRPPQELCRAAASGGRIVRPSGYEHDVSAPPKMRVFPHLLNVTLTNQRARPCCPAHLLGSSASPGDDVPNRCSGDRASIVGTCLPLTSDVREVVLGQGLLASMLDCAATLTVALALCSFAPCRRNTIALSIPTAVMRARSRPAK